MGISKHLRDITNHASRALNKPTSVEGRNFASLRLQKIIPLVKRPLRGLPVFAVEVIGIHDEVGRVQILMIAINSVIMWQLAAILAFMKMHADPGGYQALPSLTYASAHC